MVHLSCRYILYYPFSLFNLYYYRDQVNVLVPYQVYNFPFFSLLSFFPFSFFILIILIESSIILLRINSSKFSNSNQSIQGLSRISHLGWIIGPFLFLLNYTDVSFHPPPSHFDKKCNERKRVKWHHTSFPQNHDNIQSRFICPSLCNLCPPLLSHSFLSLPILSFSLPIHSMSLKQLYLPLIQYNPLNPSSIL